MATLVRRCLTEVRSSEASAHSKQSLKEEHWGDGCCAPERYYVGCYAQFGACVKTSGGPRAMAGGGLVTPTLTWLSCGARLQMC